MLNVFSLFADKSLLELAIQWQESSWSRCVFTSDACIGDIMSSRLPIPVNLCTFAVFAYITLGA
jgi:hypothetical protein